MVVETSFANKTCSAVSSLRFVGVMSSLRVQVTPVNSTLSKEAQQQVAAQLVLDRTRRNAAAEVHHCHPVDYWVRTGNQ